MVADEIVIILLIILGLSVVGNYILFVKYTIEKSEKHKLEGDVHDLINHYCREIERLGGISDGQEQDKSKEWYV